METINPSPHDLELCQLLASPTSITAVVRSLADTSICLCCHQSATRIHSRYHRHLGDLPLHGVSMHLDLEVHCFFCDASDYPRHIFTERLPQVVAPSPARPLDSMRGLPQWDLLWVARQVPASYEL